ncbi:hypothetical protein KSP40_PGU001150 [Platanthera guangdongensis]|uniref:norbelladine O-methyltransferase n=1 Tax=Platanthera guangdongensis TaxID=2320717 RepID=A0ABR2LLY6_9ASPA
MILKLLRMIRSWQSCTIASTILILLGDSRLTEPCGDHVINEGELFDFAFVDGDKRNYGNYHERLMKHVRFGGLIVYDNMLWFGMVAVPENPQHEESMNSIREYFINFNKMHAADSSIELSLICMADGVTVCRRIA